MKMVECGKPLTLNVPFCVHWFSIPGAYELSKMQKRDTSRGMCVVRTICKCQNMDLSAVKFEY